MRNNKKKIYLLIELLYVFVIAILLLLFRNSYDLKTIYDNYIFAIIFVIVVFLSAFLPAPFNKILNAIFLTYIFSYIGSQVKYFDLNGMYFEYNNGLKFLFNTNNYLFIIVNIIICIVFVALYIFFQKNIFKLENNMKIRILFILILFAIPFELELYKKELKELKSNSSYYELQKESYYKYLNLKDNDEYVEEFGLLSYIYEDYKDFKNVRQYKDAIIDDIENTLDYKNTPQANSHTAIFKDKNLILIQSGLLNGFNITHDLTPNLAMMKNNGIFVDSFKTPMLSGTKIDTEFMTNTSLVPDSKNDYVVYTNPENNWPQTLPGIFKDNGYTTNFYYGNYGLYSNREAVYNNFGYDKSFYNIDVGEDVITNDKTMAETLGWISGLSNNKIMSYWVSNIENEIEPTEDNLNKVRSLYPDIDDNEARFLAQTINFDESLGILINILKETGSLNDTVIMIYGDGCVPEYSMNPEGIFGGGLIVYNENIGPEYYSKFSTAIDLIPTITNLFGLDCNSRYMIGSDIFDDNYRGFYFNDVVTDNQYWRTNDYAYDFVKGGPVWLNTELVDFYFSRNDINYKYKLINASHNIIKYNYNGD